MPQTQHGRSSHLVRNAIANGVLFAYIAIVGFFLSPFVVQHLGATRYGVWSLLVSIVGYLGIADLGIRQAVSRYIAYHHAKGGHDEASSIISAAIKLFGYLGVLAILVSAAFAFFTPMFFNIPASLVADTRIILVLGGLTVAVSLMGGVSGGVVTGLQRFDINCYLEVLVTTVRTIAIVLALWGGYGLVALACIQLAGAVLYWLAFSVAVRGLYAELQLRLGGRLLPQMRTIVSFGVSLTTIFMLSRFVTSSNTVVIAAFQPIEAVTFFAIAWTLCAYAIESAKSLSYLMSPRVSALVSIGSDRVAEEVLRVGKLSTLIVAPMAVTFLLRGESFITLWMGAEYGPASGEVLQILALAVWLEASRSVAIHSLAGMAKQRTLVLGVAVEAACSLALSIVLVRTLGIVGVALGAMLPGLVMNLQYIPRCLARAAGFSMARHYREVILLPTLSCVPFAFASAWFEQYVPATNLALFFAQVLIIAPLVPLVAWFLCLTATEQHHVRAGVRMAMDTLASKAAGRFGSR